MLTIFTKQEQKSSLYQLAKSAKFILTAKLSGIRGNRKKYPRVIQFPITYHCNSKCVMCNIWRMDYSNEFTLEELSKFIRDPLFKKVETVGINGGEPILVKQLPGFADQILTLPKLKSLNIITHGFNKKQLLPVLEKIYTLCKEKSINFHVSISLDGYGEIHNIVRGLKVFNIVDASIKEIIQNKHKYCDTYDVGCTVIKQNVDYLIELDVYAEKNNFNIRYRMGIENKRIESNKLKDQFSLFPDKSIQSAKEFFHGRFFKARNLFDKFRYYAIYYFLTTRHRKRLLGCYWQEDGVTLDSRGELYYCAVESEKLGGLRKKDGEEIFFDEKNIKYRESIVSNQCNNCIHDYYGKPYLSSIWGFFRNLFFERFYWVIYLLKVRFT